MTEPSLNRYGSIRNPETVNFISFDICVDITFTSPSFHRTVKSSTHDDVRVSENITVFKMDIAIHFYEVSW